MTGRLRPEPDEGGSVSRRDMLRYLGLGALALGAVPILDACSSTAPSTTGTTSATTAGGAGAKPFKVGFAYVGPVSDNGWTFTHDEGRKALEAAFPNVKTSFVESVAFSTEATQTFDRLATDNDMVIVNSEYADLLAPAVQNHPKIPFLEANGHTIGKYPNLNAYYVAHHKPAYIMGVAAGMLTKNGKLGYVGAFPTSSTYNDTNCFLMGARTARPDATLKAVMINSFFDPPKATQAASALIDGGVDVMFDIQDDTSVLQTCQKRGVWSCIWNRDNRKFGPDVFVNAIDLKWQDYYHAQVKLAMDGQFKQLSDIAILDLSKGVDTVTWGDKVPSTVATAGDAARTKVLGGFEPYTGPISDATGKERVPAGSALTLSQVYRVDWSIGGVTGVK